MAATVRVPAWGSFRWGGYAWGGSSAVGTPEAPTAIYALEANDRRQVVALVDDGASGIPVWAYWNPAPAEWGEVLAGYPNDVPAFFAVDGGGAYPSAAVESPVFEVGNDEEAQIAGVYVKFVARPTVMDNFDGGGGTDPFFTIRVRGWGVAGVSSDGALGFDTQVVQSSAVTTTITDTDVDDTPWPAHRTAWVPCRLDQSVTSYQVLVTACFGVEFLAFRPVGVRRSRAAGR